MEAECCLYQTTISDTTIYKKTQSKFLITIIMACLITAIIFFFMELNKTPGNGKAQIKNSLIRKTSSVILLIISLLSTTMEMANAFKISLH